MQNRYTGDIGDYGKLGLLRCLEKEGLKVGVNWYLTPDESHNGDGRHVQYLEKPSFRECDVRLWEELGRIVRSGVREVGALQSSDILKAVFYDVCLDFSQTEPFERPVLRREWHKNALEKLKGMDLVFVDPDNGLMVPSAVKSKKGNKYVLPEELYDYYQSGASVIYYQHKARRPDSFYTEQNERLLQEGSLCGASGLGVKFTTISQRFYFFLIQPRHKMVIRHCVQSMMEHGWEKHFHIC